MPAIALKDDSKQLAAFLLLEGAAPIAACKARTCIFMVPPLPLSSRLRDVFSRLKLKEFTAAIHVSEGLCQLTGPVGAADAFELALPNGGNDKWKILRNGMVVAFGTCEFAK